MLNVVKLALSVGLRDGRWRILLTVLSIAVAIAVATMTVSAKLKASEIINASANQPLLEVTAAIGSYLPYSYIEKIKNIPGVKKVGWRGAANGTDGRGVTVRVQEYPVDFQETTPRGAAIISDEALKRWQQDRTGVIASEQTMALFGWKIGEHVTMASNVGALSGTLHGVVTGLLGAGYISFWHYEYVNEQPGNTNKDMVRIAVACQPGADLVATAQLIDSQFENSADPTLTVSSEEYARALAASSSTIPELLAQVGLLIFVVTGISAANLLAIAFYRRRTSFGTLRALGFTSGQVTLMILVEAVSITMLGGLLGVGISEMIFGAKLLDLPFPFNQLAVSPQTAAVVLFAAFALGVATAILPIVAVWRRGVLTLLAGE